MQPSLAKAQKAFAGDAIEEAIELLSQAKEVLRGAGVASSSVTSAMSDLRLKLDSIRHPKRYYKGRYLIGVYADSGETLVAAFDNAEQLAVWLDCSPRAARVMIGDGSVGGFRLIKVPI